MLKNWGQEDFQQVTKKLFSGERPKTVRRRLIIAKKPGLKK